MVLVEDWSRVRGFEVVKRVRNDLTPRIEKFQVQELTSNTHSGVELYSFAVTNVQSK